MINKILILVIIIFLINHLTEGVIFNSIKNYFEICRENFDNLLNPSNNKKFINLQNKILHYNKDNTDDLHSFINSLISLNNDFYDFSSSNNQRLLAEQQTVNKILNQLIKKINNHEEYKFNNVKLLNKIYYYQNSKGKIIDPFNISADVYHKNKSNGSIIINLEMFLKENNSNDSQLIITNVSLIERTYPNNITKPVSKISSHNHNYKKAVKKNKNMVKKMTESFNSHFVNRDVYDDLFIKPNTQHTTEGFMNDTENSLIPSIVELSSYEASSYEPSSETQSSN
jgi:hypothetical protein